MKVALQVVSSVILLLLCHQAPPASSSNRHQVPSANSSNQSQQLCNKWEASCRKRSIYCRESEPPSSRAVVWDGCCSLQNVSEAGSGVYTLRGLAGTFSTMQAYCELNDEHQGWTLVHRRTNGSLSFDRTWKEFEEGFGDLEDEFWLGLKAMHLMTDMGEWKLRVDMLVSEGEREQLVPVSEGERKELVPVSVEYNHFQVAGPEQNYKLNASEFNTSTMYDILMGFHGNPFSTHDRDNDGWAGSCAELNKGGWWYPPTCFSDKGLNLNKEYEDGGLEWKRSIYAAAVNVKSIEMKIRPSTCVATTV